MTEVVAALIWDHGKFMICQRPPEKKRGLLWEFVGGKVEPGESKESALIRECREELAVDIRVDDVFVELNHIYPDIAIHLTLFNAAIISGVPQKLEHNDIRWIKPDEISAYEFCPADADILKLILLESCLLKKRDSKYQKFQSTLVPTKDSSRIIGVRMPILRKIAKAMQNDFATFPTYLPHRYHEEDLIHAINISVLTDYKQAVEALDNFLPHVDNWAVCDTIIPKCFLSHPEQLSKDTLRWIRSEHPYTVRFGISVLMRYFLDAEFCEAFMDDVVSIHNNNYYVNMMRAWYFATALDKQYDSAVEILRDYRLDRWTHNKTIQKAIESYRISDARKDYIRTLRRK